MSNSVNVREVVLAMLIEIIEEDNYSHIVMNQTLKKYQYLEKKDRAFLQRLTEGCVEQRIHLDYIIDQFSKVKTTKMKPVIRNILRMGVYQIKFMDGVPDSAACNEAVKLAVKKGFHTLKGFVNGVLRNIIRNKDDIKYPDVDKEPVKYLSVWYSMPDWIIIKWLNEYDFNTVKSILEYSLANKATSIRTNKLKISPEQLEERLISEGVTVQKSELFDYAFKISGYNYLSHMNSFQEGLFQVQDESSMLVSEIANVRENNIVIDVCAAPGGKSLHIAEKLKGTGKVISRDLTEYKTELIIENRDRLGITNMTVEVADATELDKNCIEYADLVIADLPCSGLGVIGKKTDIKYKMTKEKQDELVLMQRQILKVVSQYVKKGGTLIYSTCTVNRDENEENVKWILDEFDFSLDSLDSYIPSKLHSETTKKGYIQLLPGEHDTDGFFIARFVRNKE
ncbi:16S rRNA (cytosine(967)-C(5))-methyltransferase RsmB [Anaeromicropila herbilytica]|uniref:16S rRNA (cytosine(967)-C(5))-methyltransferase n=1 Tax=Anaeromicropila herbilytica TaxID=2785025 RepID=A0A7R7EMG0_9FIRM|nr:16S rRNA (cytosine(967)-C(5))-methyltransferase RsmB [Anaeromicropila herbilytica]BCN31571.1 ribosomal RNA small subunit methyltransferase B [Anaeromicropila herbilytica]